MAYVLMRRLAVLMRAGGPWLWLALLLPGGPAALARPLAAPGPVAWTACATCWRLPQTDYDRVMLLCQISDQLWTQRTDSAAVYARQALALARRMRYRHGEGEALNRLGAALRESNLARALEVFQQSLRIAEATHDRALEAQNLRSIGIIYVYLRDKRQGLALLLPGPEIGRAAARRAPHGD